ncbi:hypothetical protein ACLOJK_036128 [Asimina triloba]
MPPISKGPYSTGPGPSPGPDLPYVPYLHEIQELYEHVAKELAKFVGREGEAGFENIPGGRRKELGFTVSFPVVHKSFGPLIEWTKPQGYSYPGCDVDIEQVNDTLGALAGARYLSSHVMASVILGTGTNAAYVELASAVHKWRGPEPKSGHMIFEKLVSGMHLAEIVRRVLSKIAEDSHLFGAPFLPN